MTRIPLSAASAALLRALIMRAGTTRDRILLSEIRSTEWQSLTLIGERHLLRLRVTGPGADAVVRTLVLGIEDAEFQIPGQIVADIAVVGTAERNPDGSITVSLEALTIAE